MTSYEMYRGKCREMSEAAVIADPTLTLVRGHYDCPHWGEQSHWWTVRPDGTINDPTKDQFPSSGNGIYTPFTGMINCDECGKEVAESEAIVAGNGRYALCSGSCYGRFVGL